MPTPLPNNLAELTPEMLDTIANERGKDFAQDVKTNQIRNVFSHINEMRMNYRKEKSYSAVERDLILLKPKLAYAKGRQPRALGDFQKFMFEAVDAVSGASDKQKALENFFALVEAVVAYHKFHGGEDN